MVERSAVNRSVVGSSPTLVVSKEMVPETYRSTKYFVDRNTKNILFLSNKKWILY